MTPNVAPAIGTTSLRGGWSIDRVVSVVREATRKSVPQVKDLAASLRTGNLVEDARSVYNWILRHVEYRKDTRGREEVKTASRTVSDGYGDCEDMTILAVALLKNMGHESARAAIIAQHHPAAPWSHIFAVVGHKSRPGNQPQGYIIDPVPPLTGFDQSAPSISRLMNVYLLEGVEAPDYSIAGYGSIRPATPFTRSLIDQQSAILEGIAGLDEDVAAEAAGPALRKMHALIMSNDLPEQETLAAIMPYVQDISIDGVLQFRADAPWQALAEFLEEEGEELEGIGARMSRAERQARREALRRKAREERAARRSDPNRPGLIRRVARAAVRFNPVTIAVRNGLLLALRLNMFNLAAHLGLSYLDGNRAGLDAGQFAKLKNARATVEKIHKGMGGDLAALERAIMAGAAKAARKGKSLRGLGEPVAAAGTAAASGLLAKIGLLLKKLDFKKLLANVDKEKLAKLVLSKAGAAANDPEPSTANQPARPGGYRNADEQARAAAVAANPKSSPKDSLKDRYRTEPPSPAPDAASQDNVPSVERETTDPPASGGGNTILLLGLAAAGLFILTQSK